MKGIGKNAEHLKNRVSVVADWIRMHQSKSVSYILLNLIAMPRLKHVEERRHDGFDKRRLVVTSVLSFCIVYFHRCVRMTL